MTNEAVWLDRVRRWRASGLTSAEFAAKAGVSAGGLRHWSSRLGRAGKVDPETRGRRRKVREVAAARPTGRMTGVSLARVVLGRGHAAPSSVDRGEVALDGPRGSVAVEIGSARVRVEAGFDPSLLRSVVLALVEVGS